MRTAPRQRLVRSIALALLSGVLWLAVGMELHACPWCKTNALQKPTVTADMPDPGGTFFGKRPDPRLTRHYYIAAEPVLWNFLPKGKDPIREVPIPATLIGRTTSPKIRYVQYTDEKFTIKALEDERLGIMGPVLRGQVGEYLAVTFLNRSDRPLSMHPHGVKYDKDSEGASYFPGRGKGAAIAPGAQFTYVWQLDANSGPGPGEPSSKAWLYHSHVATHEEINLGLFGCIIVADPTRARDDGTPKDVDREEAALFMIFNETPPDEDDSGPNPGGAPNTETARLNQIAGSLHTLRQQEIGARHAINGRIFGNLDGLVMRQNERVRWHLFALGSERDFHTAHWHGATVLQEQRRRTDVVELLPGSMVTVDMVADNPGQWLFHCHVADHMMEGMYAAYTILPTDAKTNGLDQPFFADTLPPRAMTFTQAALQFSGKADAEKVEGKITGEFTAINPLPLADAEVTLTIAGAKTAFHLDAQGVAAANHTSLRFQPGNRDTNRMGVTYQMMVQVDGTAWSKTFAGAGLRGANAVNVDAPLELVINGRKISGSLPLRFTPSADSGGAALLR